MPPGKPIHVLGMDIGYAVTEHTVWDGIARKAHCRLAMWSRVKLSYAGRVQVLKTMAYSTAWYLGSIWDCPRETVTTLDRMSRYFFSATQTAAVRLAQTRVRRAAAEELWWVHNREAWVRDGGDDARRRSATPAEWAKKWSGLLRLRRHASCPEGYDLRPGTPLVSGWPKGQ